MRKKSARQHINYVDPAEMAEIISNKELLNKLKAGHRDAKAMRGKFINEDSNLLER